MAQQITPILIIIVFMVVILTLVIRLRKQITTESTIHHEPFSSLRGIFKGQSSAVERDKDRV